MSTHVPLSRKPVGPNSGRTFRAVTCVNSETDSPWSTCFLSPPKLEMGALFCALPSSGLYRKRRTFYNMKQVPFCVVVGRTSWQDSMAGGKEQARAQKTREVDESPIRSAVNGDKGYHLDRGLPLWTRKLSSTSESFWFSTYSFDATMSQFLKYKWLRHKSNQLTDV